MLERLLINIRLWYLSSSKIWAILLALICFGLFACYLFVSCPINFAIIVTIGMVIVGVSICFLPYTGVLWFYAINFIIPDELKDIPFLVIFIVLTTIGLFIDKMREVETTKFVHASQNYLIFAFWIIMSISIIFAYNREYCLTPFLWFTCLFTLYFITINLINSREKFNHLVWTICIVFVFLSIRGCIDYLFYDVSRIYGAGGDDNHFALTLNMALPFALYLIVTERHILRQGITIISFILMIAAIVLTFSRGGFIGLIIVLLLFFLKLRKPIFLFMYLFLFIFLLLSTLVLAPQVYLERMNTIQSFQEDSSAMARIHAWEAGGKMIMERPLVGIGIGNFDKFIYRYNPKLEGLMAHNTFIQIASECGLPALMIFTILIIGSILQLSRLRKRFPKVWLEPFSHMIEISLAAYVICGSFLSEANLELFWLLLAMSTCLKNIIQRMNEANLS